MKIVSWLALGLFVLLINAHAQTPAELSEIWEKHHVSNILPSNVRHKDLKNYLDGLKKVGLKVNEVGRSYSNREIYQVEFGTGPSALSARQVQDYAEVTGGQVLYFGRSGAKYLMPGPFLLPASVWALETAKREFEAICIKHWR